MLHRHSTTTLRRWGAHAPPSWPMKYEATQGAQAATDVGTMAESAEATASPYLVSCKGSREAHPQARAVQHS